VGGREGAAPQMRGYNDDEIMGRKYRGPLRVGRPLFSAVLLQLIIVAFSIASHGQEPALTTTQDKAYRADGSGAAGTFSNTSNAKICQPRLLSYLFNVTSRFESYQRCHSSIVQPRKSYIRRRTLVRDRHARPANVQRGRRCSLAWHLLQSVIKLCSESEPEWLRNFLW
jgi:hypothetical protein